MRSFGGELTREQQKQLVIQAYKKLKTSFDELSRPDGAKKNPAKTCKDLKIAHPEKESGEVQKQYNFTVIETF